MQLFDQQDADAASEDFKYFGGATGLLNLYVAGDLGGGTLHIEAETPDESTHVPVASVTEPGLHVISAAPFVGRVRLDGSTSANVSVWAEAESPKSVARVREDS
ncbi:hypothetical protein [Billgrantia desiderata]|uniref:hypothetical protein n=1 Tax=Billgrantia desiderata TaxID=52021 RepID=UPI001F27697E|nr:hypothetical protein [Halomonas desiderata]MCE8012888.1 hypothetical protein [Halomonas desiderata]